MGFSKASLAEIVESGEEAIEAHFDLWRWGVRDGLLSEGSRACGYQYLHVLEHLCRFRRRAYLAEVIDPGVEFVHAPMKRLDAHYGACSVSFEMWDCLFAVVSRSESVKFFAI